MSWRVGGRGYSNDFILLARIFRSDWFTVVFLEADKTLILLNYITKVLNMSGSQIWLDIKSGLNQHEFWLNLGSVLLIF